MKKRLKLMRRTGFETLIMTLDRRHEEFICKLENVVEICRKVGLIIESAHAPYTEPGVNNFWQDNSRGDLIEKKYFDALEFASKYKIKIVVFHLHCGKESNSTEVGIKRLNRMVKFAEKNNINIAIENLYSYDELDFIFTKILSPNLGFYYDTGHENCLTPQARVLLTSTEKD